MRHALTWLGLLAFFLTLGFALQNNTNLRAVRSEVTQLEEVITEEHSRLGVLRADYANLTRIARLERLAAKYLQELRVVEPRQVRVLQADDKTEELRTTRAPVPPTKQALSYEKLR